MRIPSSSTSSPSRGNESTSVGPGSSMKRTWSSSISASSTNETESSTAPSPSPWRVARASETSPSASTGADCRSETRITGWSSSVMARSALDLELGLRVPPVRLDDVLHDPVADHVTAAQVDERDPVDVREDLLDHSQAGPLSGRQVDLGRIAVDHGLRPEAQACEEHL